MLFEDPGTIAVGQPNLVGEGGRGGNFERLDGNAVPYGTSTTSRRFVAWRLQTARLKLQYLINCMKLQTASSDVILNETIMLLGLVNPPSNMEQDTKWTQTSPLQGETTS